MQFSPTYTKIEWGLLFSIVLVDIVWMLSTTFTYKYNILEFVFSFSIVGFIFGIGLVYTYLRPDYQLQTTLISASLFLSFTVFVGIYCCMLGTVSFPLYNSTLDSLDSLLGFNALELVTWFRAHPNLNNVFEIIYETFNLQIPLVFFYFGFYKSPLNFQRFVVQFMISLFLTITISGFLPAFGTYAWYHFDPSPLQVRDFEHLSILRQKILYLKGSALVEFPSFHTILSLMYIYVFRNEKKYIFIPILILNILIIFSCLSNGGHYLADIWSGIAVFALTLWIEISIYKSVKKYGSIRDLVSSSLPKKKNYTPKKIVATING